MMGRRAKIACPKLPATLGLVLCIGLLACSSTLPRPRAVDAVVRSELLPTRVRLLSNHELERSVQRLLDLDVPVATRLPPDVRQAGYTPNAARTLSAAGGARWAALSEELATLASARTPQAFVAPCRRDACERHFVTALARRAWRRAPERDEVEALLGVYRHMPARLLPVLLQSPSFLYVTELGASEATGPIIALSQWEIASALSFTLSGDAPDDELLDLAADSALGDPDVRKTQARRLLGRSATRRHIERFVLEWLEVDDLADTAKDEFTHPTYEALKARMLEETRAFVDEVMVHHGASLSSLLTAGFVSVPPAMARYYALDAFGPAVPVRDSGRLGILQHGSFLSAHAHPDGTSPVKRGDWVLRKVLCKELPRPAELGIEVMMPQPQPDRTTRELFTAHNADPHCNSCHQSIDPLGYTFENFDEAGARRTTDAGRPVQTRAELSLDGERLEFEDSLGLARWLANTPKASRCFTRQAFRYFSAQHETKTEAVLLRVQDALPEHSRGSLIEVLVAYAGSHEFAIRRRVP